MVVVLKNSNMRIRILILICAFIVACKEKKQTIVEPIKINLQERPVINKKVVNDDNYELNIDKNIVLGKFNYRKDTSFVKVDKCHSSKKIYLNKEVYNAFVQMFYQAKFENNNLKIISGTRNFYEQKVIWERKWKRYKNLIPITRAKKILEYSSMPSTSRHHWGTDIDLNNLNNSYFEKGRGKKEYNWLVNNANKYGFYLVYTPKENGRKGYNMEKWHWSYMPLAKKCLKFYNESIRIGDINGFKGAELSKELDVISSYVNGISKQFIDEK